LAIVKKFINLMGGDIVVESEEGKGSKFTITLPMELTQGPQSVSGQEGEVNSKQ
jgi:signal transduction histidine kinase